MILKLFTIISLGAIASCSGQSAKEKIQKTFSNQNEDEKKPTDSSDGFSPNIGTQVPTGDLNPLNLAGNLVSFPDCSQVKTFIVNEQLKAAKRQYDDALRYYVERGDEVIMYDTAAPGGAPEPAMESAVNRESAASAPSADDGASSEAATSTGPEDYSNTNNQVVGIEEADIIKTTGSHIFAIAQGKLQVVKSWPLEEASLVASQDFEDLPRELLLNDDKLLIVIANPKATPLPPPTEGGRASPGYDPGASASGGGTTVGAAPEPVRALALDSMVSRPYYSGSSYDHSAIRVSVFDISNPAVPALKHTHLLKGQFVQARRSGSSVRLILQSHIGLPTSLQWDVPWEERAGMSKEAYKERLTEIYRKNEVLIKEQTLESLLTSDTPYQTIDHTEDLQSIDTNDCSNIHIPTASAPLGRTSVVTLNLDDNSLAQTHLLSQAQEIYASSESLYISNSYWWWWQEATSEDVTFLHKFDLTDPKNAVYKASGSIEGTILNQFAMDEHQGVLRVASTDNQMEAASQAQDDGAEIARNDVISSMPVSSNTTVNRVVTLKEQDGKLVVQGQTPDLAKGERIYSVRFMGDRGYVVTFRQVDPLYTLDLSTPEQPKVVGELKIPGFSSYIHPIGDGHLLTIGQDADPATGRTRGLKLSVFDVSNMAEPKEAVTRLLDQGLWSEAQSSHKAFTYFAAQKALAIPVQGWERSSTTGERFINGIAVFNIDVNQGITEQGMLNMNFSADGNTYYEAASRSIFMDDALYGFGSQGLRAAKLDDLTMPLATIPFASSDDGKVWIPEYE